MTQKFKEGDKVEIVAEVDGHEFNIGDKVVITACNPTANQGTGDYQAHNEDGEYWWVTDCEIKKQ